MWVCTLEKHIWDGVCTRKCHAEFVVVVIDKRLLARLELSAGGARGKPLPSVDPLAGGADNDAT